jgi:hypothetical protein
MNPQMQNLVAEAQALLDRAESEGRGLNRQEKRQADHLLEQVEEIKDNRHFGKASTSTTGRSTKAEAVTTSLRFAQAIVAAGFNPKSNPSVTIPLRTALGKAPTLPGVVDWNRADPVLVPMGRDVRFLNANLVQQSVDRESAIQDFGRRRER